MSRSEAIKATAHKVARSHFIWDDEKIVFDDQSQPLKASLAQFSVGIAEFARILRLTDQALKNWKTSTSSAERYDAIFNVLSRRLVYADKLHKHQVKNQTCHRSWRFDMYGPFKPLEVRALFEVVPGNGVQETDLHLHPYIESGHIADLPSDFRDILLHIFKTMVTDANGGDAKNASFDAILYRLTQPECSNHAEMQAYLEKNLRDNNGANVTLINGKGERSAYREIVATCAQGEQLNQLRRAIVIARTILFGGQISLANMPSDSMTLIDKKETYDDTDGVDVKKNAKVTLNRILHVLEFLKSQKDLARKNEDLTLAKITWFHLYSLYVELFTAFKTEFDTEPPFDNGVSLKWFDEHSKILYTSIRRELLQIPEKTATMDQSVMDKFLEPIDGSKLMELRYAFELLLSRPYHSEKKCANNVRSLNWTYCGAANCVPYNLMLVQERKSATC